MHAGRPPLRVLVRLAFHDCASPQCDGCIDTTDTLNNRGLDQTVNVLEPICVKYNLGMADCWAAAGSIAVEETSRTGSYTAQVPLFFGREDAPSCTGFTSESPEATFPSASVGACCNSSLAMVCEHRANCQAGWQLYWSINVSALSTRYYSGGAHVSTY